MTDTKIPAVGSIQWAMDAGHLYRVDGINKYGQLTTRATTPIDAARAALYRGESYSVWVPSGTELTVWHVYGGKIGGLRMRNAQRYIVVRGEVQELTTC